jgi:N6-L-threonylcarbamoyladenine synthase
MLNNEKTLRPAIALLVSGGHSSILQINNLVKDVKVKGATIDDAAGEAFDKVARIMGLGFPGGPVIDSEAKNGKADEIVFPRSLSQNFDIQKHRYDFSFSGLKTAVLRYLEQTPNYKKADVAASFQEAVVDVLLTKSLAACQESGIDNLVIAGGVAANSRLRQLAIARCQAAKVELSIPPANLCTDNGAMVAALGSLAINEGLAPSQLGISADSAAEISRVIF